MRLITKDVPNTREILDGLCLILMIVDSVDWLPDCKMYWNSITSFLTVEGYIHILKAEY